MAPMHGRPVTRAILLRGQRAGFAGTAARLNPSLKEDAMSAKQKIKASELVKDLRDGMTNHDVMDKYGLLSEQLTEVFSKLIDAKVMSQAELSFRFPSSRRTIASVQIRQSSRHYPPEMFRIYDLDDLARELGVHDVSEKGLHVVGMNTSISATVSFLVQAMEFDDIDPFTFDAQCRWTRLERMATEDPIYHAGFEITEIDQHAQEQLSKIMDKFPPREE
jgi:hypothetical protein